MPFTIITYYPPEKAYIFSLSIRKHINTELQLLKYAQAIIWYSLNNQEKQQAKRIVTRCSSNLAIFEEIAHKKQYMFIYATVKSERQRIHNECMEIIDQRIRILEAQFIAHTAAIKLL